MRYLLVLLLVSGCGAGFFSASTTATYEILPDGTKKISYVSNKEQQGLDVDLREESGQVKNLKIHVDKSTTVEAAIAAALQTQVLMAEMMKELLGLAKAGAMKGM